MQVACRIGAVALGLLGLLACVRQDKRNPDDLAGGSVVENEVAGLIRYADGSPAPGAEVKVYAVGYVPGPDAAPKRSAAQGPIFVTRTDAQGRYALESLPKGEYNILGKKDALFSYRDSVFLSGKPAALVPDTLDAPGSMTGWVALQPNHDRQSVTVQALGTETYANADADGRFTLGSLAAGRYTVRVVTTEEKYTPLYVSISIGAGRSDTLADTLRPVFTGIPVVTGLRAAYDTLQGVVTLSWNRARYPQLQEYHVFRTLASDLTIPAAPLARVTDTVFRDTLAAFGPGGLAQADSVLLRLAYRVKAVDQSDREGLAFGKAEVDAPSPFFVRPAFGTRISNHPSGTPLAGGAASPGDSLRIETRFHDPARRLARISWFPGAGTRALRTVDIDPPEKDGTVSLFYVTGSPGVDTVRMEAVDDAGSIWKTFTLIPVDRDDPVVALGADTLVPRGGTIRLHAQASDARGRIAEYAWDLYGAGVFTRGSGADTVFPAPAGFDHLPCKVRVTDDDGNTAIATRQVDVSLEWGETASSVDRFHGGLAGSKAVEFNGKLWLTGGHTRDGVAPGESGFYLASSPDGSAWTRVDPLQGIPSRTDHAAVVFRDSLWILGGRDPREWLGAIYRGDYRYDVIVSADGQDWRTATHDAFPSAGGFAVVAFRDRLWCIGGAFSPQEPVGVWSSADGAHWTESVSDAPLPPVAAHAAVVHDGSIYVIGGWDPTTARARQEVWRSGDGVRWEKIAYTPPYGPIVSHAALDFDGYIWVLGGLNGAIDPYYINGFADRKTRAIWYSKDGVSWQAMDPSAQVAAAGQDAPFRTRQPAAAVFHGALWSLFGQIDVNTFSGKVWRAR